jgi:hypothetical protein
VIIRENGLQSTAHFRRFDGVTIFASAAGFRHLRRSWTENPGWVDA